MNSQQALASVFGSTPTLQTQATIFSDTLPMHHSLVENQSASASSVCQSVPNHDSQKGKVARSLKQYNSDEAIATFLDE